MMKDLNGRRTGASSFAEDFLNSANKKLLNIEKLHNSADNYTTSREKIDTGFYINYYLKTSLYNSAISFEVEDYYGI